MKKLIALSLALTSLSTFAGNIMNKDTGEVITFSKKTITRPAQDKETKGEVIEVEVMETDLRNAGGGLKQTDLKVLHTAILSPDSTKYRLFSTVEDYTCAFWYSTKYGDCDPSVGEYIATILIPFVNIPTVFAVVLDSVFTVYELPANLVSKSLSNSALKDIRTAMFTDKEVAVKNRKFRRIFNILK